MILRAYTNGNTEVTLYYDGTKSRRWPSGEAPTPVFPESVDLKVTDWCDAGCAYCHECSTVKGLHADLEATKRLLLGAQRGLEVAIGGGDPFSWPPLEAFLLWCRAEGLVPSITVNDTHVARSHAQIAAWSRAGLFYGLGVSYTGRAKDFCWGLISHPHVVAHLIAGISQPQPPSVSRVLVLGYKQYGRGLRVWSPEVLDNIRHWKFRLPYLLSHGCGEGETVWAFDNLALEQLDVRAYVTPLTWDELYMGSEGHFSMYLDAVTQQYAATSTEPRTPVGTLTLGAMFANVRRQALENPRNPWRV